MANRQETFTAEGSFEAQVSESVTGMVGFQVIGVSAGSGTITFEGTLDDSNWVSLLAKNIASQSVPTSATTTADGIFVVDAAGLLKVRARVSTFGSGSFVITRMPQVG